MSESAPRPAPASGTIRAVEPVWHEFAANFVFAGGLEPYFAADRRVKDGGGSQSATFRDGDERWIIKLYYQDSGLVHPGDRLPTGTPFRLDTIREFRLSVKRHPEEDPVGEQKFNAHIAPRWQGMRAEADDGEPVEIDVPPSIREGVNVRVSGANVDASRYLYLLQRAAQAVGIAGHYFTDPHPYSNVQDAERYVRIHTDASGPIHSRDGPLASLGHLLENDREGYRKVVQNDDDEQGRNLPGYYHTVTLDPRRVREAFPSHSLPVEVKHYYAREALSKPTDDPLRHPKLGVSYQVNRWDGSLGVTDDDLEELRRELDRTLHAVLIDAGIEIAPDRESGPYVADAYFDGEVGEHGEPPSLNLAHVRHEQESVVVRNLTDGLSPVEWESLETLVTDGGTVSPAEIAEEHARNTQSVRRALRRMDDLVERKYGEVALRSTYVAELVHDAVQEARESHRRAVDAAGKALAAAERGLDERTSALLAWCASHDVDVETRGEAVERIRMGEIERGPPGKPYQHVLKRLREAVALWREAGRDAENLKQADVEYRHPDDKGTRLVPVGRFVS